MTPTNHRVSCLGLFCFIPELSNLDISAEVDMRTAPMAETPTGVVTPADSVLGLSGSGGVELDEKEHREALVRRVTAVFHGSDRAAVDDDDEDEDKTMEEDEESSRDDDGSIDEDDDEEEGGVTIDMQGDRLYFGTGIGSSSNSSSNEDENECSSSKTGSAEGDEEAAQTMSVTQPDIVGPDNIQFIYRPRITHTNPNSCPLHLNNHLRTAPLAPPSPLSLASPLVPALPFAEAQGKHTTYRCAGSKALYVAVRDSVGHK